MTRGILNTRSDCMNEQTIRFKDIGVFYRLYEQKNKDTLIMLHPFTSSISVFDNQIISLKKDYQLLLIDLPGHGRSGLSSSVSAKDMPEIIKVIIDLHDIDKVSIIGVELGSLCAQAFAQVYPDKIKSLISVGAYSIFHESYKAVKNEQFLSKMTMAFKWLFSFKSYKANYAASAAVSEAGKTLFEKSQKSFKRRGILAKKGLNRFYKLGKQKQAYPTYIICGAFEPEVIKDACILYEQKVPKALLEGFPRAKTAAHLDQQRLFTERVITFLKPL